jgi:hypothetical protein
MTVQDLTFAHPSLVAPLHIRGPWMTVGTCCRSSGRALPIIPSSAVTPHHRGWVP